MKRTKMAVSILSMILTAALAASAQDNPAPPTGSGPQQGQRKGPSSGKKIGPQDGSGPIHTPGTGGGTGAGQRRGRR